MRTLFGRTTANPPSRFLNEIPDNLKEETNVPQDRYRRGAGNGGAYSGRGFGSSGGSNFGHRGTSEAGSGAARPSGGVTGARGSASTAGSQNSGVTVTVGASGAKAAKPIGGGSDGFNAGDKVSHGKWGIGTVVAIKGTGNDTELQIAFPAPVGVKRLLAGFAPITKVTE
ncbi:ATP-dependent DNA helicase PcrA [compost metagenome]